MASMQMKIVAICSREGPELELPLTDIFVNSMGFKIGCFKRKRNKTVFLYL